MHPCTHRTLTGLIYSALLDPSCWQDFLDRTSAEIGGARMQIHGWTDAAGSSFAATTGYDPKEIDKYRRDDLARLNPWTRTIISAPLGLVLPSQKLCPERELKKTAFYEEWVRPQDISVGAGVVIGRTPSGPFMFGANIRKRDEQSKQPRLLELMGRLAPHLTLAWRLGQTMFEAQLRLEVVHEGAARPRAALILLRPDRTVAFADEAGEELLSEGGPCRLDHFGRFGLRYGLAERALACALRELVRSDAPVALRASGSNGGPAFSFVGLDYSRLPDWPLATFLNRTQKSLLCVIEYPSAAKTASHLAIFGLTAAEQEVAKAIARGEATALIAEQRSVSLATVRSQVQAIYAKCGIRNRAALTALVLGVR